MSLTIVPLIVILAFLRAVILDEVDHNEFVVVSTSQRPSEIQQLSDKIEKVEKLLKLSATVNENTGRLDAMNPTVTELQKKIDSFTSLETHLNSKLDGMSKEIIKTQEQLKDFIISRTQSPSKQKLPKHCKEVLERGYNVTGIYSIQPEFTPDVFLVRCNMELRGGGWTYFHRRYDGTQDFYLGWEDYKNGFGNLVTEFWLGLEHLYQLTGHEVNELLIELVDWDLKKVYAHYNIFSIGNEREGYFLKALGEYSGDAGDSMSYQAGSKFSTKDKDQDKFSLSCANSYAGAWWFKACFNAHLNGQYLSANLSISDKNEGLSWILFRGDFYSLKEAKMMVRPQQKIEKS